MFLTELIAILREAFAAIHGSSARYVVLKMQGCGDTWEVKLRCEEKHFLTGSGEDIDKALASTALQLLQQLRGGKEHIQLRGQLEGALGSIIAETYGQ